jgi:hypothetical protein
MEDVTSLVCEQIDEARDLCAVALVCKAWLRAARRAAGYRLHLLPINPARDVRGMTEIPGNRLVSFDAPVPASIWAVPAAASSHCSIWDLSKGTVVSTLATTEPITAIAWVPGTEGRLAISATNRSYHLENATSSLRTYSPSTGKVQLDIPLEGVPDIHQLLVLPTTGILVAASDLSEILYDFTTGAEVARLPGNFVTHSWRTRRVKQRMVALPGGSFAATSLLQQFFASSFERTVRIFDATGMLKQTVQTEVAYTTPPIMMPDGGNELLFGQRHDSSTYSGLSVPVPGVSLFLIKVPLCPEQVRMIAQLDVWISRLGRPKIHFMDTEAAEA